MRRIKAEKISDAVARALIEANTHLPEDVVYALQAALEKESSARARRFLEIILENAELACNEGWALCQDTGMVVAEVEVGQEVYIEGDFSQAINQGVKTGYERGYFRKSVVKDPFNRINSGDNTPAIIHTCLVPGEEIRIALLPKGAGSENMGQLAMLKPAAGLEGVKDFIIKVVREAGANPCPPIIVGVGAGGNMETAALLAKKALLRPVNQHHPRSDLAELEAEMLEEVNRLGIGPQGMGGDTTALAVNIEVYPTHIASLPAAVSLGCHSTRRMVVTI
ncbi:fumarate hydratase [Syntrophomonas curvata]